MAQEQDDINLTNQELQVLSELDSRQFGFLKLNTPEQVKKKELVLKAVRYLERMLVQAQRQKEQNKRTATEGCGGDQPEVIVGKEINIDPKTYCKLGHFHLLLEDYVKAMSAYQKFFGLKSDYWKDANFLYGQGLVYFHFNAFQCGLLCLHYQAKVSKMTDLCLLLKMKASQSLKKSNFSHAATRHHIPEDMSH